MKRTLLLLLLVVLVQGDDLQSSNTMDSAPAGDCGCKMSRESNPAVSGYHAGMAATEAAAEGALAAGSSYDASLSADVVLIPGGIAYIGNDQPVLVSDGEGPRRAVQLTSFYLDRYAVSNEAFAAFIAATAYETENERFGWSFVFHSAVPAHIKSTIQQAVLGAEWWLPVNGSTWRSPEGPGSDVFASNRGDHPVVQVSWNDAVAFCTWRGGRLPTEAEWEVAASGPHRRSKRKLSLFPWGTGIEPRNQHRMNIFHGDFPTSNSADDGYVYTAPVHAYSPQNDYGLYNMLGNVWEWVQDWWTIHHDQEDGEEALLVDPQGPAEGRDKVKKGGSFLCHRSYCYRYRLGSRFQSTPDSAASNIGFRCARSATEHEEL